MAQRVDAPKDYITRALEAAIASLRRSKTKQHNPLMNDIIDKDIAIYTTAMNTITEIK